MFTYKNVKNYSFLIIGFLLIIASIIPKGAWSYFNDVEEIPNTLGVGTCKFVATTSEFNLLNMFPSDEDLKKSINITLKNNGSFFINSLRLKALLDKNNFSGSGNGQETAENFAYQFDLNFYANGELLNEQPITLDQLAAPNNPKDIAEWLPERGLNAGQQMNLTVEFTFVLKGNQYKDIFEDKSLPAEFMVEGICGNDGGDPGTPGDPGEWDKSSLSFNGPYGSSNGEIFATVKNGSGSRDMQGPVAYEVYWIASGNPKNGTVVGGGEIPALDSGESYRLKHTPEQTGVYKFKAYQRSGHPGQGALWSWSITVSK